MEEGLTNTKKVYVEFEMLEHIPTNAKDASLYSHNGVYLLKRDDGAMSVAYVEKDAENTFLTQFYETFVGCPSLHPAASMVHVNELKAVKERYKEDLESEKRHLDDEYEKKMLQLEHEYEMKKKDLESEMPKRFEQCEWVSGKTLSEIIKTLVTKN